MNIPDLIWTPPRALLTHLGAEIHDLIECFIHAYVLSQSNWSARKDTKMEATIIDAICINQMELAVRWRISHRTLERWRWTGEGPKYLKVGGRVVYRVADIEAYEQTLVRTSTPGSSRHQAEGSQLNA